MVELSTPSDTEIALKRTFDAPRVKVFRAFSTPALLKRWLWGPDPWRLEVCDVSFRPGGAMRYVWRHPEQGDMGLRGSVKEFAPPERIVHTELFDRDWTGGETTVTTTFAEQGAGTKVTTRVRYANRAARDGALKVPFTDGCEQSYRRLDALLAAGS